MFRVPPWQPIYKAGDSFPDTPSVPMVRQIIEASPQWFADQGDSASVIADGVVNQNLGTIYQFLAQQRLMNQGCAQVRQGHLMLPQMRLYYQTVQHTEMLEIVVTPENAQSGSNSVDNVFDIEAKFLGWPLPGWQASGGGSGWWIGPQFGNYYYNPFFSPDWVNTSNAQLVEDPPAGMVSLKWVPDPSFSDWSNTNVGGSGVCNTPLSGKQYWEVEIVALPPPGSTPPTISASQVGAGQNIQATYADPSYTMTDPGGENATISYTWSWPSSLDTWLSPVIGLVPQQFVDPTWEKNTVSFTGVIGLDPDPTLPRSIGAVRTSLIEGGWSSSSTGTAEGTLAIETTDNNGTPSPQQYFLWYQFAGGWANNYINYINDQAPQYFSAPYPVPTGDTSWAPGAICVVGDTYLVGSAGGMVGGGGGTRTGFPATGPAVGPTADQCAAYATAYMAAGPVAPDLMQAGDAYFTVLAIVGIGMLMGYSVGGTVTFNPGVPITSSQSGTKYFGDVFYASDTLDSDANLVPTGINTPGRHTWVIKGRGDALFSTQTPSHDQTAQPTSTPPLLGVWTGVDLGDLQEGDIVMLAADTASREVSYGKNGTWYGGGYATKMDGAGTGPGRVLYYPACSWRFGPLHLRMRFGDRQRYAPPEGFTQYTSPYAPPATS